MRIGRSGILALAAAALAGCASENLALVPAELPAPPAVAARPPQGRVGYFIPVQYRSLVVRGPDGVASHPYRDVEAAYRQMLANVYGDVVRLDTLDQAETMRVAGVRYVVAPEIDLRTMPAGGAAAWASTVTVEITSNVRCASGALVASPQAVGQSTTGPIESVLGPGAVGRRAMAEALAKTQAALMDVKLPGGDSGDRCAAPPL